MIQSATTSVEPRDYGEAFPASRKVHVDGPHGVRVPMREIRLSGGEPPLRVYDTSGPLGADVRAGLPPLRAEWVRARGDVEPSGRTVVTASPGVEMPAALLNAPLRAKAGARTGACSRRWRPGSRARCACRSVGAA